MTRSETLVRKSECEMLAKLSATATDN